VLVVLSPNCVSYLPLPLIWLKQSQWTLRARAEIEQSPCGASGDGGRDAASLHAAPLHDNELFEPSEAAIRWADIQQGADVDAGSGLPSGKLLPTMRDASRIAAATSAATITPTAVPLVDLWARRQSSSQSISSQSSSGTGVTGDSIATAGVMSQLSGSLPSGAPLRSPLEVLQQLPYLALRSPRRRLLAGQGSGMRSPGADARRSQQCLRGLLCVGRFPDQDEA
jgi:hypothetical protein